MKELDFLPASYHLAALRRQQQRRNILMTAVLGACMLLLHAANHQRLASAHACLATLRGATGAFQNARELAAAHQQRREVLITRSALLDKLEDNAPLDAILGEVSRLLTPAMALRNLEMQASDLAADESANSSGRSAAKAAAQTPRMPLRGKTRVRLIGLAANDIDVGVFFGKLSSCPLFDDVQMVFSQETTVQDRPMREFELSFLVKRVEVKP